MWGKDGEGMKYFIAAIIIYILAYYLANRKRKNELTNNFMEVIKKRVK
jgi:hypothetical protein